jgi:hypothetical protein
MDQLLSLSRLAAAILTVISSLAPGATAAASNAPPLSPLLIDAKGQPITSKRQWLKQREALRKEWIAVLGDLAVRRPPLKTEMLNAEHLPDFTRQHVRYEIEPGTPWPSTSVTGQAYRVKAASVSSSVTGAIIWYLGPRITKSAFQGENHEVLALVAPRAFLLLAGNSADHDGSQVFIDAAKPVYELLGSEPALRFFNHGLGHRYPREARAVAENFLEANLENAGRVNTR